MTWQPAGIVYPDLELVATTQIRTALAGRSEPFAQDVWVDNTRPGADVFKKLGRPYPKRMVVCRRDGGAEGELRDEGRLAIRVWAPTEKEATDLASLVNALFSLAANGAPILRVRRQSGPLPIPDDAGPQRYSLFDIETRGAVL